MKKLIISIGTLRNGGAERIVSEISAMFCDHFLEVVILTWIEAPVFYTLDKRIRLVCAERECGSGNRIRQAIWVRSFVKKEHPAVFLSFLMPFNMLSIVALGGIKTRVVVCERQDPSVVKTPLARFLRNILYHFAARVEVQTQDGKSYFDRFLQYKIAVIPNPTHISRAQRDNAMATLKKPRIVTVGRLIHLKNQALLIDAFARVHSKFPEYTLDIYGDGELKQSLQNKIDADGLSHYARLCGITNDVPGSIASAQVFVLSSNVEGMPNALMEAMALGIPCISTDVSGVRDIIDDGVNGYVVPIGDKKAMADKMQILIESDDLRREFSDKSDNIFERFDRENIFRQWLDLVSF